MLEQGERPGASIDAERKQEWFDDDEALDACDTG